MALLVDLYISKHRLVKQGIHESIFKQEQVIKEKYNIYFSMFSVQRDDRDLTSSNNAFY